MNVATLLIIDVFLCVKCTMGIGTEWGIVYSSRVYLVLQCIATDRIKAKVICEFEPVNYFSISRHNIGKWLPSKEM